MRANTSLAALLLVTACKDAPAPPSAEPIATPSPSAPSAPSGPAAPMTPDPSVGAAVFEKKGCVQCHGATNTRFGPTLKGKWGKPAALSDGSAVLFDEAYVRESLLAPNAKLTLNYPGTMPNFTGLLKDHEIAALIEFLKTQ